MRTAEAMVAIHGRAGADRAYADAVRAAADPAASPEDRGFANLVATFAKARYLEIARTPPEQRGRVYVRWMDRRGQLITGLLAERA